MSALQKLLPTVPTTLNLRSSTRPANAFERAVVASVVSSASPYERNAAEIVRSLWGDDKAALQMVNRAAVSPMNTGNSGGLISNETQSFALNLPGSAASRLFAAGLSGPLAGIGSVKLPRLASALPVLPTVAEGDPIPVIMMQLGSVTLGPAMKAAVLTAFTRELARSSMAEATITTILREAAGLSLDGLVFGAQAATAARPAGLLNGVTPIAATTGGTTAAATDDLTNLLAAVAAAGGTNIVIVAGARAAVGLKLRFPELEYPVWASPALAMDTLIALDASVFVSGFGPEPNIESGNSATYHFEDTAPAQIGSPDGADAGSEPDVAAPVRSLYQTDMIGLRVILDLAWVLREPARIAVINAVTWA